MTRLLRWCPEVHMGGTCGCGCGCTQPSDPDWPRDVAAPLNPHAGTKWEQPVYVHRADTRGLF